MIAFSLPNNDSRSVRADTYTPAQDAAAYSGYNLQYIRRLLNSGIIEGVRVGRVWLVKTASLDQYLKTVRTTDDRRYGPRVYQQYMDNQER